MNTEIVKIVVLLAVVFTVSEVQGLKLEKVVILSRHNIRAPLSSNLVKVTPNAWPKWNEEDSFLTAKGRVLETFMGEYFSQWLKKEGLFKECPEEKSTLFYANVLQRTRETAKVFAASAFKNCNISVYYKEGVETDPVFHPVIRNATETFKQKVIEVMQRKLDGLTLDEAYSKLNEVLDFNNSQLCKETGFCDLTKKKDEILFEVGEEPNIYGPLSIGNSVMDALLMTYYNKTNDEEIGWSKIRDEDWSLITEITKENQNVRFNASFLASHVAAPMLRKLSKIIANDDLKFAMLVGHDSNINALIASLIFKPFELPNQYEKTPVGGKMVFQKWYDEKRDRYLLKIDYVYQTTDQIRHAKPLSLKSPPNSVALQIASCTADENGFCNWTDLSKLISKTLIK